MIKAFADLDLRRRKLFGFADRRIAPRYAADQLAEMELGRFSTVVEAVDISRTGAKCRISSGFAPFDGDNVSIVFLDGTQRDGLVRWSQAQAFGLEFDRELIDPRDRLHYEHLGYDYYRQILRLQALMRIRS